MSNHLHIGHAVALGLTLRRHTNNVIDISATSGQLIVNGELSTLCVAEADANRNAPTTQVSVELFNGSDRIVRIKPSDVENAAMNICRYASQALGIVIEWQV